MCHRCHRWAALLALIAVVAMSVGRVTATSSIMQHLATKAPYAHRLPIPGAPSIHAVPDPVGYKPVYMYLVARHGTRWPTAGRLRQMAKLVHLLRDATAPEHQWAVNWTCPVHDIPYVAGELHDTGVEEMFSLGTRLRDRFPQISQQRYYPKRFPLVSTQVARAAQSANAFALGFFSPSESNTDQTGTSDGPAPHSNAVPAEQQQPPRQARNSSHSTDTSSSSSRLEGTQLDSWQGGKRRSHSSGATASSHHKRVRVHHVDSSTGASATHQPAAAASPASSNSSGEGQQHAPAATPGLFGGRGGRARHAVRAVALTMAPKKHDPLLRFFEAREDYKQHERQVERWLAPWLMSHWGRLAPTLEQRLGLPAGRLTANEVDALWQLCGFEAGVLGIQDQACKLFSEQDAQLMEWLEDVRLYEVQAYGSPINYQIATPLLADLAASLIKAASEAADHPNQLGQQEELGVVDLEDDEALLQQPLSAGTSAAGTTTSSSAGTLHSHKHRSPLQLAKLHFAHCETLTPLSALLGLFKPTGAEAAAEPSAGKDLEAELAAAEAHHSSRANPTTASSRDSSSKEASLAAGAGAAAGGGGGGTRQGPVSIDTTDDVLYAMLEEGTVQDMTAQQAAQLSQGATQPHAGSSQPHGHSTSGSGRVAHAGSGRGTDATSGSDSSSYSDISSSSSSSSSFLYRGKRWIDPLPTPEGWTPLSTGGSRRDSKHDSHISRASFTKHQTASSSARSDPATAPVGDRTQAGQEEEEDVVVVHRRRLNGGGAPAGNAARRAHDLGDSTAGELLSDASDGRGDDRMFRGGRVSPLGANLLVILYQQQQQQEQQLQQLQQQPLSGVVPEQAASGPTTATTTSSSSSRRVAQSAYNSVGHEHTAIRKVPSVEGLHPVPGTNQLEQFRVRVVWNEQVVVVPGCSGPDVPLGEFLECVAGAQAESG